MSTLTEGEPAPASEVAQASGSPDSSPELLCDLPIVEAAQDHLGYGAYAEALAELIDSPGVATPLTLAIDAPWGAGKTSLARLVERKVREWPEVRGDAPHIVCWFNAWMHSDAPSLGPALTAAVGKTVARDRSAWRQLVSPIPSGMLSPAERRHRRMLVLMLAALAALIAVFVPQALELISVSPKTGGLIGAGVLAGVPLAVSLWTGALGAAQAAATFVDDPQSQAAAGSMADVATQFARLVRSATGGRRRLVIFVDDLDRCAPERATQICETASLLLSVPDVVTVLIGDVAALRSFAARRFSGGDEGAQPDVNGTRRSAERDYGRSYFDKIVQLDFSLPPPDRPTLAKMLAERSTAPALSRASSEKRTSSREQHERPRWAWLASAYRFTCARPRRFAGFVGISTGLLLVVAAILQAIDPTHGEASNAGNTTVGFIALLLFVLWVVLGVGTLRRSLADRRTRRSTVKIDETIRDSVPSPTQASVEKIAQVVAKSIATASSTLIEQRARRAKVEQLVSEGNGELASYLPALPRSVKRVANRHYLLASVAVSRDMIGGTPPLTALHLSKWAVMMERWPELATRIIAQPSLAGELERRAKSDEHPSRNGSLSELLPTDTSHRDELIRLLRDPTSLAEIADRLVFALPAAANRPTFAS
jgi:hypothetical protein